jgi:hypothetical protein
VLGAVLFVGTAYLHGVRYDDARVRLVWLTAIGRPFARTVAALDGLGGLGLVLPMATGVLPWLTPVAAALLPLLMALAIVFHVARRERRNIVVNVVLGAIAAFVAYGRWDLIGR